MLNTGLTTGDFTTCNACHLLLTINLHGKAQPLTTEQYNKLPYTLKIAIQKADPDFKTKTNKAA
jgi:hypothetical protein